MAKKIQDWLETDVRPYREKPISWVSQFHFFRDPIRPTYSDLSYFFSPADGIILYQRKVHPGECIVPFKLKQNQPVVQGQRFSQVRYGSQVDLIVPLSSRFEFEPVQNDGDHVEAGIDPVIRVTEKSIC